MTNILLGQSYQLHGYWSKLLEASCLYAQENKIKSEKDIYNILLPRSPDKMPKETANLDMSSISRLMQDCKIKTSDMRILKEIWGLDIDDERGEI